MPNEPQSIHEFDLALIGDYFSNLERQGPGSPEVTIKTLGFIEGLTAQSRIADIGCGTGGQTMVLAAHITGRITGIDLFPKFIELFNANAKNHHIQDRVEGWVGSMDKLPFQDESLDLIWSEGAIYNIGFKRGLSEWHRFLKPGGHIAVSEATWFTTERPAEIEAFWKREYPEIDTMPVKLGQLQESGYVPVASFTLPETCWTDHFYVPQVDVQERFLEQHRGNAAAEELVANQQHEARLYEKYKTFYGYAFYIGRKM